MKLDALSATELECYEEWNSADHTGGDCDAQGYTWAAWDDERIIITEDSDGFVDANTYDADDGTGETAYRRRVEALEQIDAQFYEREDQTFEALADLNHLEDQVNYGPCSACQVLCINGVRTHETGCPQYRKLCVARDRLEKLEAY
jgi:hypothetical protein